MFYMAHKLVYSALAIGLAASVGIAKEVLLGDFNTVYTSRIGLGYYLHDWDKVTGTVGNENSSIYLLEVMDSIVKVDTTIVGDSLVTVESTVPVTRYVSIDSTNAEEGANYGIGFFGRTNNIGITVLYPVGVVGACTEYTYEYKGAAHQFVLISDGDGNDDMHYTDKDKLIPASDTLTVAHVKPGDLKDRYGWGSNHLDASTVVRVRWNLETKFPGEYLYIDNLKCIRPDGYVIAFYSDELLVKTQILPEGEMPTYTGRTPAREQSENFAYYFKGWDRTFAAATADTSYHAVFDSSLIYKMEEGETVVIEDFENCKDGEECVNEWNGKFWLDGDAGNGGKFNVTYGAFADDSSNAAKLTYLLNQDSAETPFARAVMNVNDVSARDLSTCEVIKYDYKGAAHNFRVRSSYDVGGNYHMKSVAESEVWKTELVPVATQLKQQSGWGKAVNLMDAMKRVEAFDWDIQDESGKEGSLEIDNVRCVNLPVYNITFVDGENVIEELLVSEGDMPKCHLCDSYAKKIEPTVSHRYTFTGTFTPEVVAATEDASYQVVWDSTLRAYTVTFLDGLDTLAAAEWEYGSVPSYEGTPAKAVTAQYTYTFKAWDNEFVEVTGPAAYTALFDSTLNKYLVKFVSEGKTLDSAYYEYGTKASDIKVPKASKKDTKDSTFTFDGWNAKIADVTKDVTYTAKFKAKKKESKSEAIAATAQNGFKFGFAANELTVVQPGFSMVRVQVFDMVGHLVESFDEQFDGSRIFSLAHLTQGAYMVRVVSRSQMRTARITVK